MAHTRLAASGRVEVLGCPVDVVTMREAVQRVTALVEKGRGDRRDGSGLVVTLNPEMLMLARVDPAFRDTLRRASLLVPDGIGVVRAVRRRGIPAAERVSGADMLAAYLADAARLGHRIALAGGAPGVAGEAARRLVAQHPGLRIVAAEGGAPDAALARSLARSKPDMVWAAFGHGRQERFIAEHLDTIGAAAGVGVGGTLDYIAGRARRAPSAVQRAGLEWAWRLALQPWRLRRQLVLPQYWLLERVEAARRGRR